MIRCALDYRDLAMKKFRLRKGNQAREGKEYALVEGQDALVALRRERKSGEIDKRATCRILGGGPAKHQN